MFNQTKLFLLLIIIGYISCERRGGGGGGGGEEEEEYDDSNLIAVAVTFRHGERNIFKKIKGDPYVNESNWIEGYGELRIKGKQHHFALGQWFRDYYGDFLPDLYSPKDIRVLSTDFDRTLMSAESHLAGLYPPVGYQVWNADIDWMPIPVHTVPVTEDIVLGAFKDCPKYEELYRQVEYSEEMMQKKNESVLKYLSKHTGENITMFIQLIEIHDTLFVEHHDFGYKLPKWTKRVYPQPLESLSALAFQTFAYNRGLARLKMGPFFHEILTNFNNAIQGNNFTKYNIYSAHDINIANILQTLGAYEGIRPPYASAIVIELRENMTQSGDYYINILYKNSTVSTPPAKITVSGCEFDCNLKKFKTLLKDIVINVQTREEECYQVNPLAQQFAILNVVPQGPSVMRFST